MNTIIAYVVGALGVIIAAYVSNRSTRKVSEIAAANAKERVDVTAYESAARITGGLVTQLRKEVERMNGELASTRRDLDLTRQSNRRLEGYVRSLIDVLQEHEIPVPTMQRGG